MKRRGALIVACIFAWPGAVAQAAPLHGDMLLHPRHHPRWHTIGAAATRYARRFVGVPYVWAGSTPAGFDCSGFTRYVYRHFGIGLPHSSYGQWDLGAHPSRRDLRPGDLVFFGLGHVGIWLGHGRFIHSPETGERVRVQGLAGWYGAAYSGAVRLRSAQSAWPRPVLVAAGNSVGPRHR